LRQRADALAVAALLFALLCVIAAYGATHLIRASLEFLGVMQAGWQVVFWAVIATAALLFVPALRSYSGSRRAAAALPAASSAATRSSKAAIWRVPGKAKNSSVTVASSSACITSA
jgi:hypothetical protein